MKKILYLLPLILFYSCVDNLNKSVFESLSLKELDEGIKKDSLFGIPSSGEDKDVRLSMQSIIKLMSIYLRDLYLKKHSNIV